MKVRLSLALVLSTLSVGATTAGQTLIHGVYADGNIDRFGSDVANAGDVDADGVDDFIASATLDDTAGPQFGRAGVYSGLTGELIRNHFGTTGSDQFGVAVGSAGDVDHDGHSDVIIGMPWASDNGFRHGKIWVFSGDDGSLLHELFGNSDGDNFGDDVGTLGDINGDDRAEFFVGAKQDDPNEVTGAGTAYVFDGATGAIVHEFHGLGDHAHMGHAISNAGDVNGDGTNDIVVGSPRDGVNGVYAGAAFVFDGATGSQLYVFRGQAGNYLGTSVDGAGDVNNDGFDDIIAGGNDFPQGPGYAQVFSGANGLVLYTVQYSGTQAALLFGTSVCGVGDLNNDDHDDFAAGRVGFGEGISVYNGATGTLLYDIGFPAMPLQGGIGGRLDSMGDVNADGIPDFVSSAQLHEAFASNGGAVFVYSGAQLPLDADRHYVSVGAGGTQTFDIDMGAAHAGEFYWLFGSISGSTPGLTLGAHTLPLNFDSYFEFTLVNPNVAPLGNSFGTLDVDGKATATFSIPPASDISLIGRIGNHALATLSLGPLTFTSVSNAFETVLAP